MTEPSPVLDGRARRVRRIVMTATVAAALPVAASLVAMGPASAAMSRPQVPGVPHTVPTNCVPDVGACGYPDAETSGVPGTVVLQEVPEQVSSGPGWTYKSAGYVQVSGNGADLEGLLIPYNVVITGSNVTLKDDEITQGVVSGANIKGHIPATPAPDPSLNDAVTLRHTSGVTIEDTTISGLIPDSTNLAGGIIDVYGDSTEVTIRSDNIADTSLAVRVNAGMVEGNYVHSEMTGDEGGKIGGIESNSGSEILTIEDNTVLVGSSNGYAIGLYSDYGTQGNKTIDGNLLAGGNYALYGGFNSGGPDTTNIVVNDNRFSRYFYSNGGLYGPVAHWDAAGSGNTWTGNFWDDTLAAIPEP
jgi:hypothetical protein